jgi:hypothetical protein
VGLGATRAQTLSISIAVKNASGAVDLAGPAATFQNQLQRLSAAAASLPQPTLTSQIVTKAQFWSSSQFSIEIPRKMGCKAQAA